MKQISIQMDASRVMQAISRIGYSSSAALMDIIDNSIAASATKVRLVIEKNEEKFLADRYSAKSYTVIDNGIGMSNEGIQNALKLGSIAEYSDMSLSKYGMGLKSAGLSLGTKIKVISKQNAIFSYSYNIDIELIKDEYFISEEIVSEKEQKYYNNLLEDSEHGTIVEITGSEKVENYSIATTVKHLTKKMGVVYYEFLKAKVPLHISIFDSQKDTIVKPRDILYWDEAYNNYDHENYDFKRPCKIVDTVIPIAVKTINGEEIKDALLQVVIFPRDGMRNYMNFSKEERKRIKEYDVGATNSGFFIYRNNRLIRWGEHLPELRTERLNGFRAKLHIFTEHDDVLHVDVSKQNLHISEDIQVSIINKVRTAIKIHKEIFDNCAALLKNNHAEGECATERILEFNPSDPDEIVKNLTEEEISERKRRRDKLVTRGKVMSKNINKENKNNTQGEEDQPQDFRKVSYSHKVKSDYLWKAYQDPYHGHYIVINKNHVFYEDVMVQFDEQSPARLALEFLLFSSAIAEGLTVEHLSEDDEIIEKILDKNARVMASNLSVLINENRDLFNI